MCLPLAAGAAAGAGTISSLQIAGMAISAMSAIQSYQAQSAMYKAQQAQNNQTRLLAARAMLDQTRQLSLRREQERGAAIDKTMQSNIEAAKLKGRVVASAGEAGVSGGIVSTLLRDVERTRLRNVDTINRNFENVDQQLDMEREGLYTQAKSRINNMPIAQKPSMLAAGLQIGGGMLDAYSNFADFKSDSVFQNNKTLSTGSSTPASSNKPIFT